MALSRTERHQVVRSGARRHGGVGGCAEAHTQGTYRPSRPENLVARFRMIPAANSQAAPYTSPVQGMDRMIPEYFRPRYSNLSLNPVSSVEFNRTIPLMVLRMAVSPQVCLLRI